MLPEFVAVHRRAATALDALSRQERDAVAAKLTSLHGVGIEKWAQEGVQRLQAPVHLVRVNPSLVVFFSVQPDGRFLIEDFVRQETLDRYFTAPQDPVPQT